MPCRPFVLLLALALPAGRLLLACASAPPVPASPMPEPAPAVASSSPTSELASPAAMESAATGPMPSAPAAPARSAEPPPPCIGGEIMMGACICAKGKSADATGHCVFMTACPRSANGGEVFRDESTGKCRECRPGLRPTPDGRCVR
jgi:hypothetical protein